MHDSSTSLSEVPNCLDGFHKASLDMPKNWWNLKKSSLSDHFNRYRKGQNEKSRDFWKF